MISVNLRNISNAKAFLVQNINWIDLSDDKANIVAIFGLSHEVNQTIAQLILNQASPLPEINTRLEHVAAAPSAAEAFDRVMALREYFANLCDSMVDTVVLQEDAEV